MCDTFVAMQDYTANNSIIFAKNSDREPDEAHELIHLPSKEYEKGEKVKCTYIDIPQVSKTYEILLAKPFWIWGCEMGVNEKGVVIGNEAIFTKIPYEKENGLIGMDLIRLALERSENSDMAVKVIADLLAKYGQRGACGYRDKKFKYHNSFLIADFNSAKVMECYGREWAVKKIKDAYSISNCISIEDDYDYCSDNLGEYARKKKWIKKNKKENYKKLNLKKVYTSHFLTYFSGAKRRRERSFELMNKEKGKLGILKMANILRDHFSDESKILPAYCYMCPSKATVYYFLKEISSKERKYRPSYGSNADICMHAANSIIRKSQTTGSMIVELTKDKKILIYATGTSAPCISIFKPLFLGYKKIPAENYHTGEFYDEKSIWWKHEKFHRLLLANYDKIIEEYTNERDDLEKDFITNSAKLNYDLKKELYEFSLNCFKRSKKFTERWIDKSLKIKGRKIFFYSNYWNKLSKRNRL
jgi:dipeptidase